MYQGKTNQI